MKTSRITNLLMLGCVFAGGLMADTETDRIAGRIQAAANLLTDTRAEDPSAAAEPAADQTAVKAKKSRSAKESIAIVTAGAAAGASIGAATKKGTQAIVVGAIAGGIAGLIYDRMTANKDAGTPPPEEAKQPEAAPQPGPAATR